MAVISYLDETGLNASAMVAFLREVDPDFSPPLSKRIDLLAYARKLCEDAVNLVVLNEQGDALVAASSFYCTRGRYKAASLSLIAVSRVARGRALGLELMERMVEHVRHSGMTAIETRTWSGNDSMLKLLEKVGFQEVGRETDAGGRTSVHFRLDLDEVSE